MNRAIQPSISFRIEGEPPVNVTVTETGDGDLKFQIDVDDSAGQTADINGVFFDFANSPLVDGLVATGENVTAVRFAHDDVDNLGGGVNIKGDLVNNTDLFDGGVRLGTSGMSKDDIQSTSFTLSHDTADLSIEDISGMDFGIRLTSVGDIDGSRDGSLKLGGTAPVYEAPVEETSGEVSYEGPDGETPRGGDEFDFNDDGIPSMPDEFADGGDVLIPEDGLDLDDGGYVSLPDGSDLLVDDHFHSPQDDFVFI